MKVLQSLRFHDVLYGVLVLEDGNDSLLCFTLGHSSGSILYMRLMRAAQLLFENSRL